jgi:hypothetical protein
MIDKLETHSYDGKIDINQLPDLISVGKLSLEEKKIKGIELQSRVKINPVAAHYLNAIVSSMGSSDNIDNTNSLSADDLIYLCWFHHNDQEFISVFEGQLMDMATGDCPQGRTHRLFQTLLAFT